SDVEYERLRVCGGGPSRMRSDAVRNDVNTRLGDTEASGQLVAGEMGDRQDVPCAPSRLAREPSPSGAFTRTKPFRVCEAREVVNGDDERHRQSQRSGVPGREQHVEVFAGNCTCKRDLLPPGAGLTGNQARDKSAGIERHRWSNRRIEQELVSARQIVAGPLLKQAGQVPPHAGRESAELSRVYADAHCCRCSIANAYAS